jgi:protein-L-isoaspartate(D-aspartate) O-methyltransferase
MGHHKPIKSLPIPAIHYLREAMQRREFMTGAAAAAGAAAISPALAAMPTPYDKEAIPPLTNRDAYIAWMVKNRGEDPKFLGERWARYGALMAN